MDQNQIGKLAPTPPSLLTRLRKRSETNTGVPPAIDVAAPIVTTLDITEPFRQPIAFAQYASAAAVNQTFSWNLQFSPELFEELRSAASIEFQSASWGYGGVGTAVYEAGWFARYQSEQFEVFANIASEYGITTLAGGTSNSNFELLTYPKKLPIIVPLNWADNTGQGSGRDRMVLNQITMICLRQSGSGTVFSNPVAFAELVF